jgi:hypothetical protein
MPVPPIPDDEKVPKAGPSGATDKLAERVEKQENNDRS